jgi:hypothetical protein
VLQHRRESASGCRHIDGRFRVVQLIAACARISFHVVLDLVSAVWTAVMRLHESQTAVFARRRLLRMDLVQLNKLDRMTQTRITYRGGTTKTESTRIVECSQPPHRCAHSASYRAALCCSMVRSHLRRTPPSGHRHRSPARHRCTPVRSSDSARDESEQRQEMAPQKRTRNQRMNTRRGAKCRSKATAVAIRCTVLTHRNFDLQVHSILCILHRRV